MTHYKLTSTVILHLSNESDALGEMNLSGNMTRQVEADLPFESDVSHVANVGRLVEDMELKMRNLLRMSPLFLSIYLSSDQANQWKQKRSTLEKPRMSSAIFEVSSTPCRIGSFADVKYRYRSAFGDKPRKSCPP
jgi:hypothetical protein